MSYLLSRSRSLRKPAGSELGAKKDTDTSPDSQSNARPASASPSRLPLKGPSTARHTRTASTATSKTAEDGAGPAPRSRPISGVFGLGRSASVRQPPSSSTASSSTATTTSRPPITTRNRPAVARPTSASGPSPASSSRPTTSSGLPSSTTAASSAQARGHSRTKSSATALTTSTILRPPSQTSTTTTTTTTQSTLRQPTASSSNPRPFSLHARQPSASVASSYTSAIPPRKRAPTTTTTNPDTSISHQSSHPQSPTARLRPLSKPAFTTLQQHFTPAKSLAPKPLTSTFLAPPSPSKLPTNIAISAETARLQTELLQLHLLHRDVEFVRREWEDSARRKLWDRFSAVVEKDRVVTGEEKRVVERGNVAALLRWAGGGGTDGGRGLEEKIGLLDGVLATVWELGERGGRYTRLVRRFERWVAGVEDVIESRERLDSEQGVRFVTDLDASWKTDCEGLMRRVEECKGAMGYLVHDLGRREKGGSSNSSLDRILDGVGQLLEDMLAEMELMLSIEREAVGEENEWVRRVNAEEGGREDTGRAGAGAIWRAF